MSGSDVRSGAGGVPASGRGAASLGPSAPSADWLVDGGALGALIRSTDWSSTPLGPREAWAQPLRTIVNLLVETSFPSALLWGEELRLLYNDAYAAIAGERHPHALGRSSRDVWPEVWHINEPIFRAVLERGETFYFEDKLFPIERHGVRQDTYFTLGYSPVRLEDGAIAGVLVTLQETTTAVTGLRRLERSYAEVQAILDSLAEGIMQVDAKGHVKRLNRSGVGLLGRTLDQMNELMVDSRLQIFDQQMRPLPREEQPVFVALRTGKPVRGAEIAARVDDAEARWFGVNAQPIFEQEGQVAGAVVSLFDLSGPKRVEAALRQAKADLEEHARRKDEFLAVLSHELRNPLAPIRNAIALIDRAPPGSDAFRRATAVIDRQVGHMARLVDDLLDVTRINRGKIRLQREPLDLGEVVERTLEDHRGTFVERGVELRLAAPPTRVPVRADRTRISQVVSNLLQNAAKFTAAGGRTDVRVSVDPGTGMARVEVTDDGRGIDPALLPLLFEPFVQGEATLDRASGGLGLGLALVKGLVALHGGTVAAQSEGSGRGASFSFTLPIDAEGGVAAGAATPSRRRARRVLLIEDNVDAAETLSELLAISGHTPAVAHDGHEGLEKARAWRPDAVLCDVGLPGMDGYAVARAMRADPVLAGVRLVALTGYAGPDDVARALEAGFDAHLSKPANFDALEALIVDAPDAGPSA